MFAYDFPLLSLMVISIWWMFLFAVLFGIIWAFIDNFRRHDHGAGAKALWALVILVIPLLGTLIYIVARPNEYTVGNPRGD